MKKWVIGVIAVCLWACASVCSGAYLIHLKDGREITTHEYWEEGDQIRIKQYGGVVGIGKEEVVSIEKIDDPKTIVVKSKPEMKPEDPQEKEDKEDEKGKSGDLNKEKKSEKPDKEKASKEKNPLLKEFDSLKKSFESLESMSKQEILQFDKALRNLRNKVIKAGLAGPYADQMVEILDMGSEAEKVYKKKD